MIILESFFWDQISQTIHQRKYILANTIRSTNLNFSMISDIQILYAHLQMNQHCFTSSTLIALLEPWITMRRWSSAKKHPTATWITDDYRNAKCLCHQYEWLWQKTIMILNWPASTDSSWGIWFVILMPWSTKPGLPTTLALSLIILTIKMLFGGY